MQTSNKLSCVIITRNAAQHISTALTSVVNICDEIIIVDSGSADNTLDICKKYTDKIFYNEFKGFGAQKLFAVSKATNDWILSIDADEIISDGLAQELKNIFQNKDANLLNDSNLAGFYLPIQLIFLGKKLNYGGSFIKKKLRLFNRNRANFNQNKVHESVEFSGKVIQLKNPILHNSYRNVYEYFAKFNDYTEFAATDLKQRYKKANLFDFTLRIPFEFIKRYFFQLGFLDGLEGYIWCLFCAIYPAVKYIKLLKNE